MVASSVASELRELEAHRYTQAEALDGVERETELAIGQAIGGMADDWESVVEQWTAVIARQLMDTAGPQAG